MINVLAMQLFSTLIWKQQHLHLIIFQTAVPKVINSPARASHVQKLVHGDVDASGTTGRCVSCKLWNTKFQPYLQIKRKKESKTPLMTLYLFVSLANDLGNALSFFTLPTVPSPIPHGKTTHWYMLSLLLEFKVNGVATSEEGNEHKWYLQVMALEIAVFLGK